MNDQVTLVNTQGEKVGAEDKFVAHQNPSQLHAAVSVWLINDRGETLLQQRSVQKIVGAGWWGNAICGNVRPTESAWQCAQRRLQEEIGVMGVELKPLYSFEYQAHCNEQYSEHEWDTVFVGRFEGDLDLNPNEASGATWVKVDDLVRVVREQKYLTAVETLDKTIAELKDFTQPLNIAISDATYLLTPWTIMMLQDSRLTESLTAN